MVECSVPMRTIPSYCLCTMNEEYMPKIKLQETFEKGSADSLDR